MKNNCLFVVLIITLFTTTLKAQSDFRSGYVILNSGDTLYGSIDYRSQLFMGSTCNFKPQNQDSTIRYSPNDIFGFRFVDSKYFVSKTIKKDQVEVKVFLEFLIKGKVSIYYSKDDKSEHYFIEKEGYELAELPYEQGIKYKDNTPYFYESTRHKSLLHYYLNDVPSLQNEISTLNQPDQNNLIKLAKKYHYEVCKDEECIVYEKKKALLKFNIELVGGYVNNKSEDSREFNYSSYNTYGLVVHFIMPRNNDNIYIKTGLLTTKIKPSNSESIYKIPFHIEYIFPKKHIRPTMSYGINMYKFIFSTVSLSGGVNFQFSKKVGLNLSTEVEFSNTGMVLPKKYFCYSITGGLCFTL